MSSWEGWPFQSKLSLIIREKYVCFIIIIIFFLYAKTLILIFMSVTATRSMEHYEGTDYMMLYYFRGTIQMFNAILMWIDDFDTNGFQPVFYYNRKYCTKILLWRDSLALVPLVFIHLSIVFWPDYLKFCKCHAPAFHAHSCLLHSHGVINMCWCPRKALILHVTLSFEDNIL